MHTLPINDDTARTWSKINGEYVQTINTIDELLEVSIVIYQRIEIHLLL